MPTVYFTYCTFDAAGEAISPAQLIEDVSRNERDMTELIETVVKALADGSADARLVLSIDDPLPVVGNFTPIGRTVGVAQLRHTDAEAVLILAAGAGGKLAEPLLRELQQKMAEWYPTTTMKLAFDWLTHNRLPVAATVYLRQGDPHRNLDRVAMCVASAFFRLRSGLEPEMPWNADDLP